MARHYGIPYMGSKQKLVDKIVPFILNRHPDTAHFYDLFGGGASVALYAVRKYPKLNVHYNELSTAIGGLLEHIQAGSNIPFDFVNRSEFERKYTGDDWYAGLLQTCWTFGNNQKSYLYGLDIQDYKEALTELVMTGKGDIPYIESFTNEYILKNSGKTINTRIFLNAERYKTPYQRRIVLARQIEQIGALQHLARLERLRQIQNMPGISELDITTGLSYSDVPINEREREYLSIAIRLTKTQQNIAKVALTTKNFMTGLLAVNIQSILVVTKLATSVLRSLRQLIRVACSLPPIQTNQAIITRKYTGTA